jgi:hypothetical protein
MVPENLEIFHSDSKQFGSDAFVFADLMFPHKRWPT